MSLGNLIQGGCTLTRVYSVGIAQLIIRIIGKLTNVLLKPWRRCYNISTALIILMIQSMKKNNPDERRPVTAELHEGRSVFLSCGWMCQKEQSNIRVKRFSASISQLIDTWWFQLPKCANVSIHYCIVNDSHYCHNKMLGIFNCQVSEFT